MEKYLRLPNGNKIKFYTFAITNALIVKFIDADVKELKEFFGTDIIDYIDIVNDDGNILESHNLYMKRKSMNGLTRMELHIQQRQKKFRERFHVILQQLF